MKVAIKSVIDTLAVELYKSGAKNPAWTSSIMSGLAKLGTDNNYSICLRGNEYHSEWLYDMVWYKEIEKNNINMLSEVALVIECEWSPHLKSIKYDFEKLLVANANLRLMICEAQDQKMFNRLEQYFNDAIALYRQQHKVGTFLIAILFDGDFYLHEY